MPEVLSGGMRTCQPTVTVADRGQANFGERRKAEVQLRRIPLPRTPVNRPSSWHQTSLDGIMIVVEGWLRWI